MTLILTKKGKRDKKDEKKKMKIGGKKAGESGKEREREMSIGGCTIVLQLYYLMKLTNKPIEELLKLKSEELLESESEWESKPELPEWNEMFENQQIMEHNQKIQKHIDLLKGIDAENMNKEKKKVKELTIKIHGLEVLITQALQQDAIESYQRKMDIQQKSDQLNKLVSELSEIVNESAEGEAEDKIKVGPFNVRAILEVSDDDRRLMNWIFCSHEHGDIVSTMNVIVGVNAWKMNVIEYEYIFFERPT